MAVDEAFSLSRLTAFGAAKEAGLRFCRTLRTVEDPSRPAVGRWTIGDTAAHVSHSLAANVEFMRSETSRTIEGLQDLAGFNDRNLAADDERDPDRLAHRIELSLGEFVEAAMKRPDGDLVTWHGGFQIPVTSPAAIVMSEFLVHGFDIATAEGRKPEIAREHASVVFDGLLPLIPYYVNRQTAAGLRACYEISMRGGSKVLWNFEGPDLTVAPVNTHKVDCHVSADPVAFLLVGYNRISQWTPVLKGQMVAWGRKPWLGLRLSSLLASP